MSVANAASQRVDTVPGAPVMFLLGAGASMEAGIPSSDEITRTLVGYGSHCPDPESKVIENLLRYVQVRMADYLDVRATEVNFEYVLGGLMELCKRQEYAVAPLLGVGDRVVETLEKRIPLTEVVDRLYELLRELLTIQESVNYLYPLADFVGLSRPLDIFTLNYDLSVETALDNLGTSYTVGFTERAHRLAVWAPEEFERSHYAVRLFKLHGSLDWGQYFIYPPPGPSDRATSDVIARTELYLERYPELVRFNPSAVGRVLAPDRHEGMVSVMNFGTRKEVLYASRQYTTLFGHFLASLARASVCVIAGYSFRDERVNRLIEEAVVARNGALRLVVVNTSGFELVHASPVLWKFRDADLLSTITEPLGQVLREQSLKRQVEECFNRSVSGVQWDKVRHIGLGRPDDNDPPAPKTILAAWKELRLTMSLLAFCYTRAAPRIKDLREVKDGVEAKNLGQILRPILRRTRDLCYRIWAVYDAMGLGGVYEEEHLKTAKTAVQYVGQSSDLDLARKTIVGLSEHVWYLCHHCWGASDEFEEAVQNPEYGKSLRDGPQGGPTNLQVAEMVIRKTKGDIYYLASSLNKVYKGLGYEEPFEALAHHWEGEAAEARRPTTDPGRPRPPSVSPPS